jgi:hypothetical protein
MTGAEMEAVAASTTTTTAPPCTGTTTTDVSTSQKPVVFGWGSSSEVTTSLGGENCCSTDGPQNTTEVSTAGCKTSLKPEEMKQASQKPIVETKATCIDDEVELPFAGEIGRPWLTEKDLHVLRRSVEWYFSDTNLSTDQAMHHKISQRLPEGWLCSSELMRIDQLRQLGATPEMLLKCLRKSHLETKVTLTADEIPKAQGKPDEFGKRGIFIRRRQPLPPLLSRDRLHLKGEATSIDPAPFVLVDRHQTLNRLRDLWRVQRYLKLNEVGDDTTVFWERPLPGVCHSVNKKPVVFAVGYERVVYGDHGAYIEFNESQICWKAWPHYFDKKRYRSYFDEYYTVASHSLWSEKWKNWDANPTKGVLMLYAQSRSVSDRPWAPGAGSDPHAGRPTGYADYRPGYFYCTVDENLVMAGQQDKAVRPWEGA